ncbi:protein FAR1-RELATED SEQUENCE 5-like [Arachis ipaensis]|uniref:FAR1 domain-containing protein n=1 Tax=Arachis hypogaea TaxID=3818 RepID=A0A444X265_ARAHY|nr:protein FAR1-RELATED SEQUENCE 5-like [Arachis ipaensis]RYQ83824.1 hypothetical protein Ahy_B10g102685 isoform G [Arachis hypogaea]
MPVDENVVPGLYSLHLGTAEDTQSEMNGSPSEGVGEGGGDAGGTYVDPKWQFTDDNNSFEDDDEDDMVQHGDVAGLSVADLLKKAWDSVDDAYETYRKYGRCHGFGVRKGDSGKDCDGKLVRYRFFCNREGLRETKHYNRIDRRRMHKPETRTGCQAKLSVYLDENENNWKVRKVVMEHNHELAPVGMVHLLASHRELNEAAN